MVSGVAAWATSLAGSKSWAASADIFQRHAASLSTPLSSMVMRLASSPMSGVDSTSAFFNNSR